MYEAFKYKLISYLEDLQAYHTNRTGTQHVVRCPYCGDSENPDHSHFSIKIDTSDDSPIVYRCLKDGVNSGILTEDTLNDLGIHLNDQDHDIFKAFTKKSTKFINNRKTIIQTERFLVPYFKNTQTNQIKLNYINDRLGIHLNFDDVKRYKIILNLTEFMVANEIDSIENVNDQYRWVLDQYYVGFLSANNNCIIFRFVPYLQTKKNYNRYSKIILNPYNLSKATFYSIPTQIDLLYRDKLHVHVAEGTFDILSIKENVNPQYNNQIFYASCGYGYNGIMQHLISSGICTDIHLHIYADKDKNDYDQLFYIKSDPINEWYDHIYIHRNMYDGEKDYGVPFDHIIDKYRKVR